MNAKNLLVLYLLSLALAFLVLSIYLPWWSIRTSNEVEIVLGGAASIDFKLWRTVSVVLRLNRTRSVVLGVSELAGEGQDIGALKNVLNVTFYLTLLSVALTSLLWVVAIFSIVKRSLIPQRVFNLLVVIVGVLLLATPLYMFSSFYPFIPKLERFSTFSFPYTWAEISPADVKSFWGSISIPRDIGFPSYLVGSDFWIWGAGAGWFLCFTAGLILFSVAILSWQMIPKKVV